MGSASLPHGGILLKTEQVVLLNYSVKPKMDYEQFFPKQVVNECGHENYIIGLFAILTAMYMLVDCIYMCSSSRKMNNLQTENETLKSIVLKSMERNFLRMMHQPEENSHED